MKDCSAGYNQAGGNLLVGAALQQITQERLQHWVQPSKVGPALVGTTRQLHIYHHSRNQTRGLSFATVLICIGLCYTAVECVTFQDIQLL